MKHFLRPYRSVEWFVWMGVGVGLAVTAPGAQAQSIRVFELLRGSNPLLHASSSQGYLGVWVDDVDNDRAQSLKLKEVRGALITLVDHDAPAGQIGLRVNDVVVQLNGQNVEGAEQLRRMLKEIPPGRKVSLEFSRDGILQTVSVQLVDHHMMAKDVWNKLGKEGESDSSGPAMGLMPGAGDASLPGMFHMPIWGSTLNVGAMVEPLTGQMAEYLGVPTGLMVKQVAHKSDAATAGLKPKDVILKVGADTITTLSDWDRALRSNQGKQVQITILRDSKQQTLTLQVDSKHKTGELKLDDVFPSGDCPLVAELVPRELEQFAQENAQTASQLLDQAEQFREQFNGGSFKVDEKRMEELQRQMKDFQKNFKTEELKTDPKAMEELKRQMEQFRKNFHEEQLWGAPE